MKLRPKGVAVAGPFRSSERAAKYRKVSGLKKEKYPVEQVRAGPHKGFYVTKRREGW